MTAEQQHLALCEWYGKHPHSMAMIKHWEIDGLKQTPIFELTLDWLHECEEKLILSSTGTKWERYLGNLQQLTKSIFGCVHATKEQRLEALCRTLWPERF